jgi:DNA mismatch repair protein MutS
MDQFNPPVAAPAPAPHEPDPLHERLAELDLDALSPREALERLYELKALLRKD